MRRVLTALLFFLLSACGIVKTERRPKYSGPIQTPSWKAGGIMVDQVFIGSGVVFCRARTFVNPDARLYAFAADDGARLWVSGFEPAAGESHFFVEGLLVIVDSEKRVHAVDARTGERMADAESQFDGALRGEWRDGVTYVVTAGRLTALAAKGVAVWHADLPVVINDGPVVTRNAVYVSGPPDQSRSVHAFDRKTGAAKWKWSFHGYGSAIAADDDAVYAYSAGADTASVVAIDSTKGAVKWSKPLVKANTTARPVLLGSSSMLIRDDPAGKDGGLWESGYAFRTLNRATGATEREVRTSWKYPDWVAAPPGWLFAADKSSGPLLNEGGDSAPDSWVTGVGLADGKEIWRTEPVHYGVFAPLAMGGGLVVVGISPYSAPNPKLGDPLPMGIWAFKIPAR